MHKFPKRASGTLEDVNGGEEWKLNLFFFITISENSWIM
jgi:hypothetical protein